MQFADYDLPPFLLANLEAGGLKRPTPVQAAAIPLALEGRDILGVAQTGTGKTAAFLLPLMAQLAREGQRPAERAATVLILSPTRELARQTSETAEGLAAGGKIKTTLAVGGAPIHPQTKRIRRGVDILAATPGRLLDLLERNAIDLSAVRYFVLDEADQMLDMGFLPVLKRIAPLLSPNRQTMLFSATMPKAMADVAATFLNNPAHIETSRPGEAAEGVAQSVHFVLQSDKRRLLAEHLNARRGERVLVFARTRRGVDRLAEQLERDGFEIGAIHGDKRQRERDRTIRDFKNGRVMALIATDVAARGLDIPDVTSVVNFDLPDTPESYVHRIGRTARAGASGEAVAYCAPHEMADLKAVEKLVGERLAVAGGEAWRLPPPAGGRNRNAGKPSKSRRPRGPNAAVRRKGKAKRAA